ncbi:MULTISPECIES: phosphate ABC transporter permease PstA [Caproicibacterium]|jgi:phosphate transport system permease protein|uniref:Phosphate transport system permease protein PstA n=1 Tax=Caproicibacterium lactatifermentans TaxID=2666138 RepID=A0A859DRE4_9FIRM|nr:phosphate ABC transporter permease PstA [Caproicibacterium lactatifermentans]MDD4807492.1 phosphate ABC transporter permease PstA [Oscillospiraceae bacterium]QKN24214.1 phosphate ABC transporter permease PstA [Caproicibacterium lactatifermentans]
MKNKEQAQAASRRSRTADRFMTGVFYAVAGFFLLLLLAFVAYILINGFRDATPQMLSFTEDGVGNQLFNTLYLVFLALLISVPIGILAGIYLAEYAKDGPLTHFVRICVEALSSLPSIVIGLFGYLVFILMTHSQWNLFAGALAVSLLCLPLITTTTADAFRALPQEYKEGSLALGATHWQSITKMLLPACVPRIMTGVILAAGRGFGEAAALLYTAGMSTDINWSNWNLASPTCALNPFRPGETLALQVWASRTESIAANATQIANFSSAILILLVLLFSLLARLLNRHLDRKATGTES